MEYTLKGKLDYAKKGETAQAKFIELFEFKAKQFSKTVPVKQICVRAFNSFADKADKVEIEESKKKDASEVTAEDLMTALYMSGEDLSIFFVNMRELLTSDGICSVDGESKLTKPLFDELGQDDMEGLCSTYVLNFIISSVLRDSQRTS